MISKFVFIVCLIFLFCNCASMKVYDYAEYHNSLTYDISFYSQYEIAYKIKNQIITTSFLANSNEYLPEDIIVLHIGLLINNPKRGKFVVWSEFKVTSIDTGKLIQKTRLKHVAKSLPEEFISIDMPYNTNIHSEIEFSVSVMDYSGNILYQSSKALYKIRGVQTKAVNLKF